MRADQGATVKLAPQGLLIALAVPERIRMPERAGRVGALLEALSAGDMQRVLAEIDDDVAWRLPSLGHVRQGRAATTEELQRTALISISASCMSLSMGRPV
ncbi:MAG TPA: hypothetical protein VKA58_15675 [Propionibacteriaceae bacterium]|nr:hypothetical protein [Propionibacteriaceae bacterium]